MPYHQSPLTVSKCCITSVQPGNNAHMPFRGSLLGSLWQANVEQIFIVYGYNKETLMFFICVLPFSYLCPFSLTRVATCTTSTMCHLMVISETGLLSCMTAARLRSPLLPAEITMTEQWCLTNLTSTSWIEPHKLSHSVLQRLVYCRLDSSTEEFQRKISLGWHLACEVCKLVLD